MAVPVYTKRKWRKQALLAKVEAAYGVDAVPTGAANAMLFADTTFTPIEGDEIERDYYLPYLGHQGVIPVGMYATLEFSVDVAGSGTAGVPPGYGPCLQACSMAETITADTSVVYTPVSDDEKSVSIYFNLDKVQHVLLGVRGTWTSEPTPKQIPRYKFRMMGLLGMITDTALPVANLTTFLKALPVTKENTKVSIGALDLIAESFNVDFGNDVQTRNLIGEDSIQIVDRKCKGQIVAEAMPLSVKNWFDDYKNETINTFTATHGTVAGNIVEFACAGVQIGKPAYGNTQGIVNQTLPLFFKAIAGNDDMVLTFR